MTAREPGDDTPFSVAVVVDLGLMGRDGLSTAVGPLGGSKAAQNPLGPRDLHTIQNLLQYKEYVDDVDSMHFVPPSYCFLPVHLNLSLTGVILLTRITSSKKAGRGTLATTV